MNRRLLGILLFLCLIAPAAITFLIIEEHKYKVKKEIKWKFIATMNHEELVKLQFTQQEKTTQLSWHHSKEFEYKGEMYDVVKSAVKGDTTYYWCWWDHEETDLNKKLDKLVAIALGNSPTNEESNDRLLDFFDSLYFSENSDSKPLIAFAAKKTYYDGQNFYQSILISHPVPPPEIA